MVLVTPDADKGGVKKNFNTLASNFKYCNVSSCPWL